VSWLDVQVGDFDGDHKADLVARRSDSNAVYVSHGFTTPPSLYYYGDASHPASPVQQAWATLPGASTAWADRRVGDFDGDGKDDLVTRASQTGALFVLRSSGSAFTQALWGSWDPAVDVRVGNYA